MSGNEHGLPRAAMEGWLLERCIFPISYSRFRTVWHWTLEVAGLRELNLGNGMAGFPAVSVRQSAS